MFLCRVQPLSEIVNDIRLSFLLCCYSDHCVCDISNCRMILSFVDNKQVLCSAIWWMWTKEETHSMQKKKEKHRKNNIIMLEHSLHVNFCYFEFNLIDTWMHLKFQSKISKTTTVDQSFDDHFAFLVFTLNFWHFTSHIWERAEYWKINFLFHQQM